MIVRLYLPWERISQDHTRAQIDSARANGCTVGGYVWGYRDSPPRETIIQAVALAESCGVDLPVLWIDVEDYEGTPPPGEDWLLEAGAEAMVWGERPGIYTGSTFWRKIGNPTSMSDWPLWYARYDERQVIDPVDFGGWTEPSGHQFTSTPIDQDVMLESVTR